MKKSDSKSFKETEFFKKLEKDARSVFKTSLWTLVLGWYLLKLLTLKDAWGKW